MGKVNEVKANKISMDASNRKNTYKVMHHDSLRNNSSFSINLKAEPTNLCSGWKVTRALLLLSLQGKGD